LQRASSIFICQSTPRWALFTSDGCHPLGDRESFMRTLRESADELVIFSPARAATIVTAIQLAVGFLVGLPVGVCLLVFGVVTLSDPLHGDSGLLMIVLFLGVLLCLVPVVWLVGLLLARDTEYHFLASQRKLIVRQANQERRVVPFSEIVEAVAYTKSGDMHEPDTYGLRLELRGFLRSLPVSQFDRDDDDSYRQMRQLAVRINRFLEARPSEPLGDRQG
jgi:hypothetical protein